LTAAFHGFQPYDFISNGQAKFSIKSRSQSFPEFDVLEFLFDGVDEFCVEDVMVARERELHHLARDNLAVAQTADLFLLSLDKSADL